MSRLEQWFERRGWTPFAFQRQAWSAYREGRSGLIHAPTGLGKTLAAWLGPVAEALDSAPSGDNPEPIRVIWITPLRALANDTVESLRLPVRELGLNWTVESRTGDTSTSVRTRQRKRLPTALVTTPESVTLLTTYPETSAQLWGVRAVIVDEWHELLSTKRGVQTELALAYLRSRAPELRTWGLSATLANIESAASALIGVGPSNAPAIIRGLDTKPIEIECIVPDRVERFPWSGHLGLTLLDRVIDRIERAPTTLLFTNTRSQSELWFRAIQRRRPDWIGRLAIHHGSIDRGVRERVEGLLRGDGGQSVLKCVVCTSSLDLGVDFSPVDQVIQIGSPKGVARLIQRAGRSGHRPGAVSRIVGVPTHALELIEFAAVRDAIGSQALESREPLERPLDVLAQHIVTASLAGGFHEPSLRAEVRTTHAYRDLTDEEWGWCMEFAHRGGPALGAYPQFARIGPQEGAWRIASRAHASRHRMGIGTIVGDDAVAVAY